MDKEEFLKQFKSTVKGEGGNLSTEFIIERLKMGDISEGDISSFNRYIPFQLALAVDSVMGRRKLLGILKSLAEITDAKSKFNANTDIDSAKKMIRDFKITYADIISVGYPVDKDISRAVSQQIDKFVKMVIGYKSLTKEEQNKEKFKIEKLVRMKIVSKEYLEGKKTIKEELKNILGNEFLRYLAEEPYDTEIKNLIDLYSVDESISKYLPEVYLQYYLKKFPKQSGMELSVYKKRRQMSKNIPSTALPKEDVYELQQMLLKGGDKKPKIFSSSPTKDGNQFSEKRLLDLISQLETKENKAGASNLVTRLKKLGFETKSTRKINKNSEFSKIKKQFKKEQSQRRELENEILSEKVQEVSNSSPKSRNIVTNLYSVERKLEDLKKGKSSKYLSKLDKSKLESQLIDIMKTERTINKGKQSMDIDRPYTSPISSVGSSPRSSISTQSSRRSSIGSKISRTSSRSSTSSNGSVGKFTKEKEVIPKIIPSNLVKLGKASSGGLDIDTMKVMSSFIGKSIPFVGAKMRNEDTRKLKIDIEQLKKYAAEEKKSEMKSSLKRRRSSSSGKLSPYDMKRIYENY